MNSVYLDQDKPLYIKTVGYTLILTSIALALTFNKTYILLSLIGISMQLHKGIAIDMYNTQYMKYYRLFDVSFGTWKKLPLIEHISIKQIHAPKCQANGATKPTTKSVKGNNYKICCFCLNDNCIELYRFNKENAYAMAKKISNVLKVGIFDNDHQSWM